MVSQIDFMDLIDTLGCGELRKQMTRIVGGVPADTGEWPWMAALLRDKTWIAEIRSMLIWQPRTIFRFLYRLPSL
jgi:hypothetical protein